MQGMWGCRECGDAGIRIHPNAGMQGLEYIPMQGCRDMGMQGRRDAGIRIHPNAGMKSSGSWRLQQLPGVPCPSRGEGGSQ